MLHWPVPDWAANAFVDACSYVEMGGAASWDEVFGHPHPPKKHKRSLQLENLKHGVHKRVREIVEKEGAPIDDKLFERVGRETGLGGSTVIKGLYYQVERTLRRLDDSASDSVKRAKKERESSSWGKWVAERNAAAEAKGKKQGPGTSGK